MGRGDYLKMVEDEFYNRFFIIDVIASNDNSTIQSVLKHPSIGVRGQVMKLFKGKLDDEIPEPSFLEDPSHFMKVFAKHIFYIVNKSRDQRFGCTKADALRIKKDWGNTIKKNRGKQLSSLVRQVRFPSNTFLTITTIVVQSGASRQEHQKKERHTTTNTTNSAANKMTISCTISSRRIFSCFKQTKF